MSSFLWKLAVRNLWRQKRRTFLTFIALSMGIMSLVLMDSTLTGLDDLSTKNLIEMETAHLQVKAKERFEDKTSLSLEDVFADANILAEIRSLPEVEAATSRLTITATANTGWDEYPVIAIGLDPAEDGDVFPMQQYLQGSWVESGQYQAVIGRRLGELLELEMGDYLTLLTRASTGSFQALDVEIVGVVSTPHPTINGSSVFIPIDVVRESLLVENQATEIAIKLHDSGGFLSAQSSIQSSVLNRLGAGELGAYTWRQVAEEFLAIGESKSASTALILLMLIVIAVVGVVNTILLGALERTREIGMMKAIGMREQEITKEFVYEAAIIGFLGSVVGCAMGLGINLYLVIYGFDFTALVGEIDLGYPIEGVIYGAWNWPIVAIAFVSGVIISVIAGVIPAKRAASKDPIWALRQ